MTTRPRRGFMYEVGNKVDLVKLPIYGHSWPWFLSRALHIFVINEIDGRSTRRERKKKNFRHQPSVFLSLAFSCLFFLLMFALCFVFSPLVLHIIVYMAFMSFPRYIELICFCFCHFSDYVTFMNKFLFSFFFHRILSRT